MKYMHEMVKRIIGEIEPLGESNIDEERLENLKIMCKLVNDLILDIDSVGLQKESFQGSVSKAGKYAYVFLKDELGIKE